MAKAFSISVAAADAMLNAFGALCNNGTVRLYDGSIPADVRTALGAQNVLAQLTMPATAFPTLGTSVNNRTLTAGTITDDSTADFGGTATFFRVFASAGNGGAAVWQGTVGTADADMIMLDTLIVQGGVVSITSMVVSLPMT
jgi:hypothetical protein